REQVSGAGARPGIAAGSHAFAKVLKDANRPMIIVGSSTLARADGAAILNLAAKIAGDTGAIGPADSPAEGGWVGFNVLHTAASRVAALDLGFVKGRDMAGILSGEMDFVCLLGAGGFGTSKLGN